MKTLKKGDRIRVKVRLLGGWKGFGTVSATPTSNSPDAVVWFFKDGQDTTDPFLGRNAACRHEVAAVKSSNNTQA